MRWTREIVPLLAIFSFAAAQADKDKKRVPKPRGEYFQSTTITGALDKPIPNDGKCWATKQPPVKFVSQAPQFCLVVSGQTRDRCCTPTHDEVIKQEYFGLWPADCAGDVFG